MIGPVAGPDSEKERDMDGETLERCQAYAEGLYARETDVRRWILREMERRDFPRIQVSAMEGRILALLARLSNATRLLEVGTLGGYSALWLLSLLPEDARLVTVERDERHAELAREAFRRAEEEDRTRLRVGDAREVLEQLSVEADRGEQAFDFVFLDADKENYPVYLERLKTLLRPGGVIAADNVFWEGRVLEERPEDASTRGIRRFNRMLAEDEAFETAVVPIRDGLSVAWYRG